MDLTKTSLNPTFYLLWGTLMAICGLVTFTAWELRTDRIDTSTDEYLPVYFFQELSEKLFLKEAKAKAVLDEGHTIILIKSFDVDQKRPRLFAAKQTPTEVVEIDSSWFQPSLVYLMTSEQLLIKRVNKTQLQVQGISFDTLAWMARN